MRLDPDPDCVVRVSDGIVRFMRGDESALDITLTPEQFARLVRGCVASAGLVTAQVPPYVLMLRMYYPDVDKEQTTTQYTTGWKFALEWTRDLAAEILRLELANLVRFADEHNVGKSVMRQYHGVDQDFEVMTPAVPDLDMDVATLDESPDIADVVTRLRVLICKYFDYGGDYAGSFEARREELAEIDIKKRIASLGVYSPTWWYYGNRALIASVAQDVAYSDYLDTLADKLGLC